MLNLIVGLIARDDALIAQLDSLAQKRDVASIAALSSPELKNVQKPFNFIKAGGVFGAGSRGWNVVPLRSLDGKTYAVFTTPYDTEDLGSQIYSIDGGKLGKLIPELETNGYSIRHHQFDIDFDSKALQANFKDRIEVERQSSHGPLWVRMAPMFQVKSVKDDEGKPVEFVSAGGIIELAAPDRDKFFLTIEYTGPTIENRRRSDLLEKERVLSGRAWWPTVARGASSYEATLHMPKAWTGIAQGEVVSDRVDGDQRTMTFKCDLPNCVFSAAAGAYKVATLQAGGLTYATMSLGMTDEEMQRQNEFNRVILEFYSRKLVPYPFKRWTTLVSGTYTDGALEAYSFATYGEGWLPDEDGHETGHIWFGGVVPNTYLRSLWNESFASYVDGWQKREGSVGNKEETRLAHVSVPFVDSTFNQVSCAEGSAEAGPAASSVGYGKGAYVLQMLEFELGTPMMERAMSDFCRSHKPYTTGEWEQFEQAVNRTTGKDYRWFFDQWVRRPGYADFTLDALQWTPGGITGKVAWKSQPYRISFDALCIDAKGGQELVRGEIGVDGTIRLSPKKKPERVSIDPYLRIIRPIQGNERSGMDIGSKVWVEKGRENTVAGLLGRRSTKPLPEFPKDLAGTILVGTPVKTPALAPLFKKVGFAVQGDKLTWKGTTIDLRSQGAYASVELPGGKRCVIACGAPVGHPMFGSASTALTDRYGRLLRAWTRPKTSGNLVVPVK